MFEPYKWIKSSSAIGGAGSPKDFQLSESSTCIIPSHRVDITNCASGVLAATQYLFADRKTWNWNSFGWAHILSCFSLPGCISTKISCCALRVCTKSARSSGQSKRPKRMKEWMLLGQGDMFEVLVKIYEVHHGKVRTQWGYIYIYNIHEYIYICWQLYTSRTFFPRFTTQHHSTHAQKRFCKPLEDPWHDTLRKFSVAFGILQSGFKPSHVNSCQSWFLSMAHGTSASWFITLHVRSFNTAHNSDTACATRGCTMKHAPIKRSLSI